VGKISRRASKGEKNRRLGSEGREADVRSLSACHGSSRKLLRLVGEEEGKKQVGTAGGTEGGENSFYFLKKEERGGIRWPGIIRAVRAVSGGGG